MIPRDYITEWRSRAPWADNAQVEQDLVICRALVNIFSHPVLGDALAFRGGTALYKLYLAPAARYSEDIDLVQVRAEPAGAVMDALRAVFEPWLGDITTYDLDELLGTKLRALYQRRKGRDLFDMATALSSGGVDPARIVAAFRRYMDEGGHHVTRAKFEDNLAAKLEDKRFLSDIPPLLAVRQSWNAAQAAALVLERLCPLLP